MIKKTHIIDFIKVNSYLDYEGEEDNQLQFSTRKNGSTSSEQASNIDIAEAKRLKKILLEKFNNITINIDIVDEWVLLFISEFKAKVETFGYSFIKNFNGCGFGESFDSIDKLIARFGTWVNVDWEAIKTKLDNHIFEMNDNNEFIPIKLLIKGVSEKDNKWGYNFYVAKSKKLI